MIGRLIILFKDFLLNTFASSKLIPHEIRYIAYRLYGIKTHTKNINPGCFMGDKNIKIGKNTFINYNCVFENCGDIEIGSNCDVGVEVLFCSSTHEIGSSDRRAGRVMGLPIKVEDGCWIGARTTIMPGVTIGYGCVIAANSVVTKNCEPNGLYAGVPAKRIKELSSEALKAASS